MFEKIAPSLFAAFCLALSACSEVKVPEPSVPPHPAPTESAPLAYVLADTEVRDITSGPLGRTYQLFVSLPGSYEQRPGHRFPVLFVTDASYAFPLVRNIGRMVGDRGKGLEDFALIGLSYAKGDTGQYTGGATTRRHRTAKTPYRTCQAGPSCMARPRRIADSSPMKYFLWSPSTIASI
ncbi:hypothetical protein GCM10011487_26430 [Steroidobacter agaridevorans]|uniref:Esterase n=1 Tax=Steroidobacter agaridevorans TaxID=2695856 RepID=A0A829YCG4_9GAMM|nr:hypothetical protein GCM10011487_26430 [Steroidobacter agaridevorans]